MDRYIVKYVVSENPVCISYSYRAIMADDENDARRRWSAAFPGLMIAEVHIAGAADRALGLGYYTAEEETEIKNRLHGNMERGRAERAEIKKKLLHYDGDEIAAENAYNESLKAATKNADGVHLGDIFYTSWGYDQTNITFYQVVKISGLHTITLKRVRARAGLASDWSGLTRPVRGAFYESGSAAEEKRVRTKAATYNGQPLPLAYIDKHALERYSFGDLLDYSTGA